MLMVVGCSLKMFAQVSSRLQMLVQGLHFNATTVILQPPPYAPARPSRGLPVMFTVAIVPLTLGRTPVKVYGSLEMFVKVSRSL